MHTNLFLASAPQSRGKQEEGCRVYYNKSMRVWRPGDGIKNPRERDEGREKVDYFKRSGLMRVDALGAQLRLKFEREREKRKKRNLTAKIVVKSSLEWQSLTSSVSTFSTARDKQIVYNEQCFFSEHCLLARPPWTLLLVLISSFLHFFCFLSHWLINIDNIRSAMQRCVCSRRS